MGFSVNMSTLFAIVLAIGIVVDDAIVVVEGAAHNIEQGMSGHDAAIAAMNALFGPIIGITLVLMAVFLPAAFLPGLTGQIYAQFALVIAATALISAVNAATLKPTQCAMWLRRPVPPEQRNFFYRGFNARLPAAGERLCAADRRDGAAQRRHGRSSRWRSSRRPATACRGWPTGFLPIEDQGYLLAAVQLPDGAALGRTQATLQQVAEIAKQTPGVDKVITIAGVSALDNNSTLANAGVAYIILKDWSMRGKGEDLAVALPDAQREPVGSRGRPRAGAAAAADPGHRQRRRLHHADRAARRQLRSRQAAGLGQCGGRRGRDADRASSACRRRSGPTFRSTRSRSTARRWRRCGLTTDQVFQTLASYLGSSYVNQFNKFGRVFQVYVQGDSQFRLTPEDDRAR